jgi:endonuclease YncB( thermonuclease family)
MGGFFSCCVSEEKKQLLHADWETAPAFSLNGLTLLGVVVDCYDGDTCTIAMMFRGEISSFRCRLLGIDTPEITNPATKTAAILARNALINMCCSQPLKPDNLTREQIREHLGQYKRLMTVQCGDWDKYGRLLVTLKVNEAEPRGVTCNQMLIDNGHATPYFGGTKKNVAKIPHLNNPQQC